MIFQKNTLILTVVFLFVLIMVPDTVFSGWNQIKFENRHRLDTVWGSSETDIYAVSFGNPFYNSESLNSPVFHSVNGVDWVDITATVFGNKTGCSAINIWGTGPDNVYIAGLQTVEPADDALTNEDLSDNYDHLKPVIFRYDGTVWNELIINPETSFLSEGVSHTISPDFYPNIITGIWGTSPANMYFTGGKFHAHSEEDSDTGTVRVYEETAGILLHYTGTSFNGEIGIEHFPESEMFVNSEDTPDEHLPPISEITGFSGTAIYGVGYNGLLLYKDLVTGTWSVMPSGSKDLFFNRVWAASPTDVFAVGFNNLNSLAVIYRYNGSAWLPMTIPATRDGFIPSLWGIWGDIETGIHAVGNAGATLYYDWNDANEWKQMVSNTTTSLNSAWGSSFSSMYASGEDGCIYHYTDTIKTTGVRASPGTGMAPQTVTFSDISVGEISGWIWDFGDTRLQDEPVSAIADLDYVILLSSLPGTALNGYKVMVLDNGDETGTWLELREPVSATATLDSKLSLTAVPGMEANGIRITLQDQYPPDALSAHFYNSTIFVKLNSGVTTLGELKEFLITNDICSRYIESAETDTPDSVWISGAESTSVTAEFGSTPTTIGKNHRIIVRIDSGVTTHQEIADTLTGHDMIQSALPDDPEAVWIRGLEQTQKNYAYFSGGSLSGDHYENYDTTKDGYYMASHMYHKAGTYTATLTVERPSKPASADLDLSIFIKSVPGISANGCTITLMDGGEGTTPSLSAAGKDIRVFIDSGVTTQKEISLLLKRHPLIIYASPDNPESPWNCNDVTYSNTAILSGGADMSQEKATTDIIVYPENYVDFTADIREGVQSFEAVFTETSSDEIKDRIIEWKWEFEYGATNQQNDDSNPSVLKTIARMPVSHIYSGIAYYNVRLTVTLDDESTFSRVKPEYIIVKSPDEDKSSIEGGNGCFISTIN